MPLNSSHVPSYGLYSSCFHSTSGGIVFTSFTIMNFLLLLPLLITILYVGCQRWRQRGSFSTSNSDFIAYHMAALEIISLLGSIFYCISLYANIQGLMRAAGRIFFFSSCGQMSFHCLACGECYLAVVHPITYMCLKKGSRVKVSNLIIGCLGLFNMMLLALIIQNNFVIIIVMYIVLQIFSLAIVSFCSLAVLRVLRQPVVGSELKEKVDQSKQRAFNTIKAIIGTLLFRFVGNLVCTIIYSTSEYSLNVRCVAIQLSFWFGLPSSLVLPLLFLHRAGKHPSFRNNKTDPPK